MCAEKKGAVMNNKDFKGLVVALERVAKEQNRVTSVLLEKLELTTDNLVKIIKEHDLDDDLKRFDFGDFGFRYLNSNIGSYTTICYFGANDDYRYTVANPLPTRTSDINVKFYLHNDLSRDYRYMTREKILKLCKILPEFIQNIISKIQSLTDEEKKFLNQFEKIEV